MQSRIYFFIGTEAELIKLFPVIMESRKRGLDYRIIASGQNEIIKSRIFLKTNCGNVDLELSKESEIIKSTRGLLKWFTHTYRTASGKIIRCFPDTDFKNSSIVVHGDTISTLMGAGLGKKLGMRVCHVEAGLRSHNLLNPFPEEIDRVLTSRCAQVHFAPGAEAAKNLSRSKGKVVNTGHNTLIDSLQYSLKIPVESNITKFLEDDYFVFVMHRQENLSNKKFFCSVVKRISTLAKHLMCIFIMHDITRNALDRFELLDTVRKHANIILQPRVDYFDFMKVLHNARFVITDGGSNQEELYYMGKPCLIMRKTTERSEGIGKNAILFGGEIGAIDLFASSYKSMEQNAVVAELPPSSIIVDELE